MIALGGGGNFGIKLGLREGSGLGGVQIMSSSLGNLSLSYPAIKRAKWRHQGDS